MRDKRIKLFNILIDLANKRGEIDQFENKFKDYNGWESFNFKNDQSVTDLYNKTIQLGIFSSTSKLEDFFKSLACDILKTSTYCGGGGSTTTPGTNVFGCVEAVHKSKTGKAYTSDRSQLHITRSGGIVHIFKNDYNFTYRMSTIRKTGTWACDGADNYKITLTNGQTWFSKDPKWSAVPPTPTPTPNTTTITDTNLTGEDLAAGKFVKVGMRGDIVTKIQELLIAKGFIHVSKNDKPDGIFGNRTKRMVMAFQAANGLEDDGAVGKDTWPKLNDGSSVSNSSTNQATSVKDPFEVPGSDSSIMQESRKKILRKYLQEFK